MTLTRTLCVLLIIANRIVGADVLDQWRRETDLQTRFDLARKIVSQWPGSDAAESVVAVSFTDQRYSEEQMFLIARLYYEGLSDIGESGKNASAARRILGVAAGTTQILPASLAGAPDSGSFVTYAGDSQVGKVQFELLKTGAYTAQWEEEVSGTKRAMKTAIEVDAAGYWTKITRSNVGPMPGDVTMVRQGFKVSMIGPIAPSFAGTILPNTVLVDSLANPALFAFLAKQFDPAKGGIQRIPTMTPMMPRADRATVERKDVVTLSGQPGVATKYVFTTYPLPSITFWIDSTGHTVMVSVPAFGFMGAKRFVRPGFEELLGR